MIPSDDQSHPPSPSNTIPTTGANGKYAVSGSTDDKDVKLSSADVERLVAGETVKIGALSITPSQADTQSAPRLSPEPDGSLVVFLGDDRKEAMAEPNGFVFSLQREGQTSSEVGKPAKPFGQFPKKPSVTSKPASAETDMLHRAKDDFLKGPKL
jgi:hypothetical protein